MPLLLHHSTFFYGLTLDPKHGSRAKGMIKKKSDMGSALK